MATRRKPARLHPLDALLAEDPHRLLTVRRAAELVGVSRQTVQRAVHADGAAELALASRKLETSAGGYTWIVEVRELADWTARRVAYGAGNSRTLAKLDPDLATTGKAG